MFRISRSLSPAPIMPANIDHHLTDASFLQQYCTSDHWYGDLDTGLFRMGKTSARMHGLVTDDCGLLTLLRAYQQEDRVHILQLLEKASSSPSKFCFCTNVVNADGGLQPVICIGESAGFSDSHSGTLMGVFLFPNFHISTPEH